MMDINHPRSLLPLWLGGAVDMQYYAAQAAPGISRIFLTRASTLLECAQLLYNRLLWSDML